MHNVPGALARAIATGLSTNRADPMTTADINQALKGLQHSPHFKRWDSRTGINLCIFCDAKILDVRTFAPMAMRCDRCLARAGRIRRLKAHRLPLWRRRRRP